MGCCGPVIMPAGEGCGGGSSSKSPPFEMRRPNPSGPYDSRDVRRMKADRDDKRKIKLFGGRIKFTTEQLVKLWIAAILLAVVWKAWAPNSWRRYY